MRRISGPRRHIIDGRYHWRRSRRPRQGRIPGAADTLGPGTVFDADLSVDPAQSCLFNVDGSNGLIDTLDRLKLEILASFGGFGRAAGSFNILHNFVVDSQGNIYTAEVIEGKRTQKFRIEGPKNCG